MNLNIYTSFSPNGNHCCSWGCAERPHPAPICGDTLSPNLSPCLGSEGTCTLSKSGSGGDSGAVTHHGLLLCEGTPGLKHTLWHYCSVGRHSFGHKHHSYARSVRGKEAWNTHHTMAVLSLWGDTTAVTHITAVPGLWEDIRVVKHTMAVPSLWGTLTQHGVVSVGFEDQFHSPTATDPVHFLLLRRQAERAALCAAGSVGGGNGYPRDGLQPPSRATGPFWGASSLGAPGQLLSTPPGWQRRKGW